MAQALPINKNVTGVSFRRIKTSTEGDKALRAKAALHRKYAKAVSLYADTDMTLKAIAAQCGFSRCALGKYLRMYHRELVFKRHGLSTAGVNIKDVKIFQAGHQSKTAHAKYKDAVEACQSLNYIELNVSQVARMFNVTPTGLANFLRVHYENVIPMRERIRRRLGIADNIRRGVSRIANKQYEEAVELYRSTNMTMAEIAGRCGLSESGLSQHLRFYHKDVLKLKSRQRKQATCEQTKPKDGMLGNGRKNRPSAKVVMKYAAALSLYKGTSMTMKEIVAKTGVPTEGFRFYLHKWHKKLVLERAGITTDAPESIKMTKAHIRRKATSAKYAPAIASLKRNPRPVSVAAREFGLHPDVFRQYLHKYEPELISIRAKK